MDSHRERYFGVPGWAYFAAMIGVLCLSWWRYGISGLPPEQARFGFSQPLLFVVAALGVLVGIGQLRVASRETRGEAMGIFTAAAGVCLWTRWGRGWQLLGGLLIFVGPYLTRVAYDRWAERSSNKATLEPRPPN